jgi:hypothetical protein
MTSDLMTLDLDQLRHLLVEHQAHRPIDVFVPEMKPWMARKDQLRFHIDLKEGIEARAWKDAPGPAHGWTEAAAQEVGKITKVETILPTGATKPPVPATKPPVPATEPLESVTAAVAAEETSMPAHKKRLTPKEKAEAKKRYQRAWYDRNKAKQQDAHPHQLRTKAKEVSVRQPKRELASESPARIGQHELPEGVVFLPVLPNAPAAKIRALRSLALELLPQLEDLDPEAARAVETEMCLLAETLALGGKLLRARVA